MHLVNPPKLCITIVFNVSWVTWVLWPSKEKSKTMVMQFPSFGGGEVKSKQGALWPM